mgnify:CR=1 FL=1
MKVEEFKALTDSVKALSRDHVELANSIGDATRDVEVTKKLWKSGSKPFLIKAGLALLVFPEPIVSDALGTLLLAAGAVQEGIRRQAVYVDDLPKAFQSAMRSIKNAKDMV